MGQVTIYLDDESEKALKDAARAAGVPVSRWVADSIRKRARSEWPESVWQLAGTWGDDVQRPEPTGRDVARERL